MDRIKEAISRARDNRPDTPQSVLSRKAARPSSGVQNAFEPLPVECNFELFNKHRIIANEQDPVLNAYRVLRTRVLQKMQAENWKTLAVVSPSSGAGKTVTAINLAAAISAKQQDTTALIDLDFYRPSVARYLGLKNFPSTLDFFEGKSTLQQVTLAPDLAPMLLMANERVSRRGAEYLTSSIADEMIDTTLNQFGCGTIVFDMSPLLGCDDTIAFLPKIDCVLLIAASGQTRVNELKEAKRLLGNTPILGTVLNKSPANLMANPYY